jgi:hypothetical protein
MAEGLAVFWVNGTSKFLGRSILAIPEFKFSSKVRGCLHQSLCSRHSPSDGVGST